MVSSLLYYKVLDSLFQNIIIKFSFIVLCPNIFYLMKFAALTFNDLGVVPHKLKGYPIEYLIQYRKGGPQFGSTISEKVSPDAWP